MSEHTVGGTDFVIGKLNVRQQAEVATRLGTMTFDLTQDVTEDHVEGARFIGALVTGSWGALPKADRDAIESVCLGAVRVRREGRLHPAFNVQTGLPTFDDLGIDLGVMYELIDLVIQDSLGPFFAKFKDDRNRRVAALQTTADLDSSP